MSTRLNLTGQTFTRLYVLEFSYTKNGRTFWKCLCKCNRIVIISGIHLKNGNTKSCGCLSHDKTVERNKKHGMSNSPEHRIWSGMIDRCHNPHNKYFKNYGGRGIYVDPLWHDFMIFFIDIGKRPTPKHTLERIDNNGPYCKDNVKWALHSEQMRNTRRTHWITFNDKTLCMTDWAKLLKMKLPTFSDRLRRWSIEKSICTPIRSWPSSAR